MSPLSLSLWYAGAVVLGIACAYLIGAIFRKVVVPGTSREYWDTVTRGINGILYGEDEAFWSHYRATLGASVRYVGRQLAAFVLAFTPLILALFLAGPALLELWDKGAERVVLPAGAGELRVPGDPVHGAPQVLLSDGTQVSLQPGPGSQVVCRPGSFGCLVLQGFAFKATVVETPSEVLDESLVVIRGARDDWNPLWPWLNDPEFLFFVSLSLFSLLFLTRGAGGKRDQKAAASIEPIDFFMTQLASRNARFMRRLGDWESRLRSAKLAATHVEQPVFIAGLARSGTTILLEKLATARGVATHRYRDFPFIMTPVWWNRFVSIFASRQQPVERPHQDSIKITRDSPDAFEEPIWQHYFPQVHDPKRSHVLDSGASNAEFARFFREHVQKILLIRGGDRYVSKGNYNLPRIGYLGEIFPDARFLVPVRHPLTHVYSLARQHELFTGYAKDDPRLAEYLEAVGHYEFGPQRRPICIGPEDAQPILGAWQEGNDLLGYALQWRNVYRYVLDMLDGPSGAAIRIVRFEDLCRDPASELEDILEFAGLEDRASAATLAEGITPASGKVRMSDAQADSVWQTVQEVAQGFGYGPSPSAEPSPMSRKSTSD